MGQNESAHADWSADCKRFEQDQCYSSQDRNMLEKVIKQCKMEKENARALTTQNEELKKIIMKIGVDPNDKAAVQKLMKNAKAEISSLRKKLKFPATEHSLATKVAEVEKEKEELRQ